MHVAARKDSADAWASASGGWLSTCWGVASLHAPRVPASCMVVQSTPLMLLLANTCADYAQATHAGGVMFNGCAACSGRWGVRRPAFRRHSPEAPRDLSCPQGQPPLDAEPFSWA